LLLKAFQKAPQTRCFRAPPSPAQSSSNASSVFGRRLSDADLISPLSKRWSTAALRHGMPQVTSCANFHTFSVVSSAASPDMSGKSNTPGTPVTEAAPTPGGEDMAEPVQHIETPSDEKGVAEEVSKAELMELLGERETLLQEKDKIIEELREKVLRSYAEIENVMARARREAENTRKFALQGFAKGLLDVADNLGRAAEAVPQTFRQPGGEEVDLKKAAQLLISLLQGVEMTERQLQQVFRLNGLEKFESNGEQFDPNLHAALFEVDDESKTPGTVAVVMKAGYKLHDRVIRPAEVGVVKSK